MNIHCAMDTIADPRFQELIERLGVPISFEDLGKASKYQVDYYLLTLKKRYSLVLKQLG